jgi:hypothetical protein
MGATLEDPYFKPLAATEAVGNFRPTQLRFAILRSPAAGKRREASGEGAVEVIDGLGPAARGGASSDRPWPAITRQRRGSYWPETLII